MTTTPPMKPCLVAMLVASMGCSEKTAGTEPDPGTQACNGHPALCDRRLDEVTLATTHNAMSSEAAGWIAPNQGFGITQQLEDGIRGMMLDTMDWNGEDYLCHGYCELGAQPLLEGLGEIEAIDRISVQRPDGIIVTHEGRIDARRRVTLTHQH